MPLVVLRLSHGAPGKTAAEYATGEAPDELTRNELSGFATTPPAGMNNSTPEGFKLRLDPVEMKNVTGTVMVPADDTIVTAVADYVARRLVERERAVTVDPRVAEGPRPQPAEANGPATWPIARPRMRALHFPPAGASEPLAIAEQPSARPRRGIMRRLGDVLSLFLMLLGSITLALLLGVGVYWAWITRLSDLWARWIGPPPF